MIDYFTMIMLHNLQDVTKLHDPLIHQMSHVLQNPILMTCNTSSTSTSNTGYTKRRVLLDYGARPWRHVHSDKKS